MATCARGKLKKSRSSRIQIWLVLGLVALSFCTSGVGALAADEPGNVPSTSYLFCYFVEPNGKDGLRLAWSRDGLKWEALNGGQSYLKPTVGKDKLMRDPCLLLGPDGVFRLVWTDSWTDQSIGYSASKDLLTWTDQQALPVMASEPTARNCWAPEVHYDAATRQYLIFWSTTIPGRFASTGNTAEDNYDHRIYITKTKDFHTYTPTALFFDPGYCCIDATMLPVGNKVYLIYKDEVRSPTPAKNLWLATSDQMAGPYANITGPLPTVPATWVEGPTAIQMGDDTIIYYDCYKEHHFGAIRSKDMVHWQDVTKQLALPKGIRHGTVIAVPGKIISGLLEAAQRH